MRAAPAKGTKVGLRLSPNGRWIPAIAHQLLPDGTVTFRWPPRYNRGELVLMAVNLKHPEWEWKPANQCEFQRACTSCRANGAVIRDGRPTICTDCKGKGDKPDHRPFE